MKTVIPSTFYVQDIDNSLWFYDTPLRFLVYLNMFHYSTQTDINLSFLCVALKFINTLNLTHSAFY